MSDFKAKMHQNRFRLGLYPRSRWGSLQRSPHPLAVSKGTTSKGKEGKREKMRERERGGKGKGMGEEGEGKNHLTHPLLQIPGYATVPN